MPEEQRPIHAQKIARSVLKRNTLLHKKERKQLWIVGERYKIFAHTEDQPAYLNNGNLERLELPACISFWHRRKLSTPEYA